MIFSQTTTNAFISTFKTAFTEGDPLVNESIDSLLKRKIVLRLGTLPDGEAANARIIFAPHITGDPVKFKASKTKIIDQLEEEANSKNIELNSKTGHLIRPAGSCTLCPSMQIGKCDYEHEIVSLKGKEKLYPDTALHLMKEEKMHQQLMIEKLNNIKYVSDDWDEVKEQGQRF